MGQPPVEKVKAKGAEQKTEIGYKPGYGGGIGQRCDFKRSFSHSFLRIWD